MKKRLWILLTLIGIVILLYLTTNDNVMSTNNQSDEMTEQDIVKY